VGNVQKTQRRFHVDTSEVVLIERRFSECSSEMHHAIGAVEFAVERGGRENITRDEPRTELAQLVVSLATALRTLLSV
jgi:hypothetical protein